MKVETMPRAKRGAVTLDGTRILSGPGVLDGLGESVAELRIRRPMLVSDPGLRQAGHVDRAAASLSAAGFEFVLFDDVSQNPTARQVQAGAALARSESVDGLIGIGGGSAMDCAKGANFLITNGGSIEDYTGYGRAASPLLPSIGVPTTAGTGSEAQSYALISDDESGTKLACGDATARFRTVFLDPQTLTTAPRDVRGATGIDAVTHAIESYVSSESNPVSRAFAREAWRLLDANLESVVSSAEDLGVCEAMQWGAMLAGAAIEHSMLGAAHATANPLTARYDVIHGAAVGLMLPHVIRFNGRRVSPLYQELAEMVGATDLVERFETLRRAANLPERLADCGVTRDALDRLAREASEQWTARFNPVAVGAAELREIYDAAL